MFHEFVSQSRLSLMCSSLIKLLVSAEQYTLTVFGFKELGSAVLRRSDHGKSILIKFYY